MRALPAGWPDPNAPVQDAFDVYLHVTGSAWPPASVQGGESLPAGWTRVSEWSVSCDLDAPLMPGQVNAAPKFTVATASCTIPQPVGGMLAPWRAGGERTPASGRCELVASYDGYNGATAFSLGQFILDPIKGKASEPFVSLTMVQDLIRLRHPHGMPMTVGANTAASYLRNAAARNGYAITFANAEIGSPLVGMYFPAKTDELSAMQQLTAANLSALYLSLDGQTIRVLDSAYLSGAGTPIATLDVLDSFEDLSWSQDPGAAADRVEVTYVPPTHDASAFGDIPPWDQGTPVYTFPAGARIPGYGTQTYYFDPGTQIFPTSPAFVSGTSGSDGSGTAVEMPATPVMHTSSYWTVTVYNPSQYSKYFKMIYYPPPRNGEQWGYFYDGWPKNTAAALVGTIDRSSPDSPTVLAWGVAADDATNILRYDLGKAVQSAADASYIFGKVVARVQNPSYVVDDVRVVPHVGRELGDLYRLVAEPLGFDAKAMVTGIKLGGGPGGVEQTLTVAVLG